MIVPLKKSVFIFSNSLKRISDCDSVAFKNFDLLLKLKIISPSKLTLNTIFAI